MPLTWDITHCEDSDFLTSEKQWPITNTFILMTVSTGIGNVTEANAAEVYARLRFLDKLYGPPMNAFEGGQKVGERSFTPDDVRAMIGLRTNVGPVETQASFMRRHLKWFMREGLAEYEKSLKAAVA